MINVTYYNNLNIKYKKYKFCSDTLGSRWIPPPHPHHPPTHLEGSGEEEVIEIDGYI